MAVSRVIILLLHAHLVYANPCKAPEVTKAWKSMGAVVNKDKGKGHAYIECDADRYEEGFDYSLDSYLTANPIRKVSCLKSECNGAKWCFVQNHCGGQVFGPCKKINFQMHCKKKPAQDSSQPGKRKADDGRWYAWHEFKQYYGKDARNMWEKAGNANDGDRARSTMKKARKNDVAEDYTLNANGDLFRTVNGNKCQITNQVLDMKVSSHPDDVAMLYFIKDEGKPNLYVLHNIKDAAASCPKTSKKKIQDDIEMDGRKYKYSVVSTTDTSIVNVGLSKNGLFLAFDKDKAVVNEKNVVDYMMHPKYNVKGQPFSSYVTFLINRAGNIFKVKGKTPADSKWDQSKHKDINAFMVKEKVLRAEL